MDNMNEIIAKLRKDAGLTQEQLASIIGVSPQAVSKWETHLCPTKVRFLHNSSFIRISSSTISIRAIISPFDNSIPFITSNCKEKRL